MEKKRKEDFGGSATWGKKSVENFGELKANLLRGDCPLKIDHVHAYNQPLKHYFRNNVLINTAKMRVLER